ncbi:SRC2 homolog [Olea europaea subsp. europaea]|uniref:SRC2 homolog n=1 Tax=Olea europaea subsp. europaea TaxID=158383 RepID=A0A8S0RTN1_OLEEU|nr:SRC2 homolog [Olea europaea subsp. europaea]
MSNMNCRKFEITLVSANDLSNVRTFGRMKVYAEVSIGGEPNTVKRTPADMKGETNPNWKFKIEYTLGEKAVKQGDVDLTIKLYCKRSLLSDKYVGEVNMSLKELFKKRKSSERTTSIKVKRNDAVDPRGTLVISYNFGKRIGVPRPSKWERALVAGAKILVEGTIFLFLGADIEIPIFS